MVRNEKMSNVNEDRVVYYPEDDEDFADQITNNNSPLDIQIMDITSSGQLSKKNEIQKSSTTSSQLTFNTFDVPSTVFNENSTYTPNSVQEDDLSIIEPTVPQEILSCLSNPKELSNDCISIMCPLVPNNTCPLVPSLSKRRHPESLVECINITDSNSSPDCLDDSISIIYENIKPQPEVLFVNEIIIDSSAENASTEEQSNTTTNEEYDPVIMGAYARGTYPIVDGNNIQNISEPCEKLMPSSRQNSLNVSCSYLSEASRNEPSTSKEDKTSSIACGICFDTCDEILSSSKTLMSTVCGHIFCDSCLKICFRTKKACPRCRRKLTVKQVHPIFL
ncbi:hypothetical protein CDAR_384741 [Caerostris darwini]|uniref:RING-type domain-containing protein n=1 Tax=Caerostris darwini TaxID=1538125 RepID=A0AAV4SN12_9ARAC|nr:hypothetical protein CDAR_384741 [Caerostris darwini]